MGYFLEYIQVRRNEHIMRDAKSRLFYWTT